MFCSMFCTDRWISQILCALYSIFIFQLYLRKLKCQEQNLLDNFIGLQTEY